MAVIRILFVSLLISCSLLGAKAQTFNRLIADEEYYDFINKDILRDSVKVLHHIFRRQIELKADEFYYKDTADFLEKNIRKDNYHFIFRQYVDGAGRIHRVGLDSIFKRDDIDFFDVQLRYMTGVDKWHDRLVNSVVIDTMTYQKCRKCPGGIKAKFGVWSYSLPLFSRDIRHAIIIKENSVVYAFYIYRRNVDGNWDLVQRFNEVAID